jgi:DNA-binding SARP family transcriptional activator
MDFRILGPIEALRDGRPLALGGTKQRALLGMLLLHANEVVSTDRLIEALWPDERGGRAVKALQVAVARLRRALEPDRSARADAGVVLTRPAGYELRVDPERLDATRFEAQVGEARRALAAGDAQPARSALDAALDLWRGPPLVDLRYESFAQAEIGRLEELRLGALEYRAEADLALGRHDDVVGALEAMIAEEPLRERLRGLLMLALYRSGRQADALEAYRAGRATLVDELGIEPGRELRRLHQAILQQDPGLDLAVPSEPPADTPRAAFVGREAELAELTAGLAEAFAGRGRLFLLSGEPGIGKSRLAEELIGRARSRGGMVLVGRCWEAGGAPAYWPWVQSLRAYVRETDPKRLRAQLGAGAADLSQLLPELRELLPDLPDPPAQESEGVRFRLFEAVTALLREAAKLRPVVLVLDDLHAADEPSLLLLRFLAREIAESRVLVVCAYRDVDPTMRDPLTSTLAELVREAHTAQISLAGLSEPDVIRYIELSTGREPAAGLARAIHAETEGTPLFVAEVVRLLDAEGRIADPEAHPTIPPGVRAVIGRRVGRLSDRCQDLLAAASVMGREFGLDPLARLSALGRVELLEVLDEAMAERLLGDVPGSPGRLRFGHALIRDTLYDELTPARKLQLHQEVGRALEAVYAADLEPHLSELAQHFVAAAPAAGAEEAIEYAHRAGNRAASQLAYEEAVRLYRTALALTDDPVTRCELLIAIGDAQARAGDTPAAKRAFHEAAELAEARGLPEHLARAALGYGGRILWDVSRDDDQLAPLLERALVALGDEDSTLRVRLLARLAGGPLRDTRYPPDRKAELSREALEAARRMGDHGTLAYALDGYIAANHSPVHTVEQVAIATELVELAIETGDLERAVEGYEHRLGGLIELGEMERAKADLAAMDERARELRQPSQVWFVAALGAHLALLEGRFGEAEGLIERARGLGARAQSWNAEVSFALQLYLLRREQGRLEQVEALVRRSVDDYPTYRIWRCVLVQMTAELGHAAEAREKLEALAQDDFAALPVDEMWLASTALLAEAVGSLRHARAAAKLYELMLPFEDRIAVGYSEFSLGSVARYLGLLAVTMARREDAERHFKDALDMNRRVGARPWLAHTKRDYARMLLARATPEGRDEAHELLAGALATYRELAMGALDQVLELRESATSGTASRSKR